MLILRDAELNGRITDVTVADARVVSIGGAPQASDSDVLDCAGGAVLPGLHDHHIHLVSLAADLESVHVGPRDVRGPRAMAEVLLRASRGKERSTWTRATGYHESVAGDIDCRVLDAMVGDIPLRVQHRSGAMWVLSSRAIELCRLANDPHPGVELDVRGVPTGRVIGADAWLRTRLPPGPTPDMAAASRLLAGYGVTGVTDATPSSAPEDLAFLAESVERQFVRQRVVATGGIALASSAWPDALGQGPVKIVVADYDMPGIEELARDISDAHSSGRPVAIHCVTHEATVVALAAWHESGVKCGDRIEHGSVISAENEELVKALGLIVVTQPSFVRERGDIYSREVDADERPYLYRCRSLLQIGIPVAGSTDAPFGSADPWLAARSAVERKTVSGTVLGPGETVTPEEALGMFLAPLDSPGARTRAVTVGASADFCVLRTGLREALEHLDSDHVAFTVCGGDVVFER